MRNLQISIITKSIHTPLEPKVIFVCDIFFSNSLTNEAVSQAIKRNSQLLIVSKGDFACHGAIYLRSIVRLGLSNIYCVISMSDFAGFKNLKKITLFPDGNLGFNGENKYYIQNKNNLNFSQLAPHYRLLSKDTNRIICYWPHRKINPLEFSLRSEGLIISALSLGGKSVKCFHNSNGQIEFLGAPSLLDLRNIALSITLSQKNRQAQISSYDYILDELRKFDTYHVSNFNKVFFEKEVQKLMVLVREYYSHFFLYHDTYYQIFEYCIHRALPLCNIFSRKIILEMILRSTTVDEYVSRNELPEVEKGFFFNGAVTNLPSLLLSEEINVEKERILKKINTIINDKKQFKNRRHALKYILFASEVFCIKERKFLLNKCIYSRLSRTLISILKLNNMIVTPREFNRNFTGLSIYKFLEKYCNEA